MCPQPYKLHKLDDGPSTSVSCTRDEALVLYRRMQTIRRLETSAGNLYKEKIIRGFCHLYSGQVGLRHGPSQAEPSGQRQGSPARPPCDKV